MGNKSCGLCSFECCFTEKIIQNSDRKLFPYVKKKSFEHFSIFRITVSCANSFATRYHENYSALQNSFLSPLCRENSCRIVHSPKAHNVGWWIWLAPSWAVQLVKLLLWLTMLPYVSEEKEFFSRLSCLWLSQLLSKASHQICMWREIGSSRVSEWENLTWKYTPSARDMSKWKLKEFFFLSFHLMQAYSLRLHTFVIKF